MNQTEDFFRSRLDQTIDLRHPLATENDPHEEGSAFYCRDFRRAAYAGCGQILMWASGISCRSLSITFPKRFENEFFLDD